MKNRNLPLFKVFMSKEASSNLNEVLYSGNIGQGPKVDEFEKKLVEYLGNPYVNTVNSATSGLHLALHLIKKLDTQGRDEVITTPLTCTATNFPILANGLKIKWADIDSNTCNLCLADVRRKIGPKTLAVMVVHWGGYPCDLDELELIKKETKVLYGTDLHIIEDCAHALGSKFKNRMIGNSNNLCIFSFQAIKHLTTGDGGLITSSCSKFHNKAKLLRWYGIDRTTSSDLRCDQNVFDWGFKFHMNDIAASIGLSNFQHLDWIISTHNKNYKFLYSKLKTINGITLMVQNDDYYSSSWVKTLLVEKRDDFMRKMKDYGIGSSKVHGRNDKHECVRDFKCLLPTTDFVCNIMCCIPCGWWLSEEDCQYIVDVISQGW